MKKKYILILVILVICAIQVFSQTPSWNWALDVHTAGNEAATDVAIDPATGDIYVAGYWTTNLSAFFPTGALPSQNFTSLYGGTSDGFVAKYDNTGTLLWAFKVGCNRSDMINAVTVDPSGNFYITGYFEDNTARFTGTGALTATTSLVNADDDDDFFIAKYNSDGELLWVRQGYSTGGRDIGGTDVAACNGGVFAVGYYNDPAIFGALNVPDDGMFNQPFLICYDPNGNEQWVMHGATNNHDYSTQSYFNGVETDGTNVYIVGNFKGATLDVIDNTSTVVATAVNVNDGNPDIALMSFTAGGVFNWLQTIGSTNDDEDKSIVLDANNIYITGGISNNANFPSYLGNPVSSSGNMDIFISSHSKIDGTTNWVNSISSSNSGDQHGYSIDIDVYSNILISGYFDGNLDFSGTALNSVGNNDGFVASFKSDGSFYWAKTIGSSANDEAFGIASGSTDMVYVVGDYEDLVNLDGISLTNDGQDNIFIAQISPCVNAVGGTTSTTDADICIGSGTTINLTGSNGSIQWQSSLTGSDTWSDISGETTTSISVSPVSSTDYRAVVSSEFCSSDTSTVLTITVNPLPTATISGDASICESDITPITINFTGTAPFDFIYTDGSVPTSISNHPTNSYVFNVSPTDTTTYTVTSVTDNNTCTNSGSGSATINVKPQLTITIHPQDVTTCLGDNASFSVEAIGVNKQYQWQKDGVDIAGVTSTSLFLNAITLADVGDYTCIITSDCGGPLTSNTATLSLYQETAITLQPSDEHYCYGQNLNLQVNATGSSITYQWKKDGVDLADGGNISGVTTNLLVITGVTTAETGFYSCEVSGQCGTVESDQAYVVVDAQTIITSQPTSKQACPGSNTSFTIAATGTNLTYQWRKDGIDLAGETSQSLVLNNVDASYAGIYRCQVTSDCGQSTLSSSATLVVNEPTAITSHPVDALECIGNNIAFSVTATGSNLTYQWYKDGAPLADGGDLSGTTTDVVLVDNLTLADAGLYTCEVTGSCGTLTSNSADLVVADDIVITTQPVSQSACIGDNINFSVTATGSGLTYQWSKDGTNIVGATNSSLSINNIDLADAGDYQCEITNSCGATLNSVNVSLTVNTAVSITLQPTDAIRCIGDNVTFQTGATGSGLSYQWYHDGLALVDGADVSGATTNTLFRSNLQTVNSGTYICEVTGSCNVLNSDPAVLTIDDDIVITQQSADKEACEGDNITFTVIATGSNLTYQWQKDAVDLAGETNTTLTINNVSAGEVGLYRCIISNSCGNSSISSVADLVLNPTTVITSQPVDVTSCIGENISFNVTATGATLTYQWQKNGSDIIDGGSVSGSTTNTLTISGIVSGDIGVYSCVVSGSCGTENSDPANLSINENITITTHPQNQQVCEGNNATFNVIATGSGLSYQWQKNNVDIGGGTNSSLILSGITIADAGVYRCVVSGTCNSLNTNGASLVVNQPPSITSQPVNDEICENSATGFQVIATGTSLTYQWKFNGVNLADDGNIVGSASSSMNILVATTAEAGVYTCEISNICGTANSTTATLTVDENIVITKHPQNKTLCEGDNALFTVEATGSNLLYQWQKDGVNIGGETNSSLILNNLASANQGTYRCVITGDCGTIVSNGASLVTSSGISVTAQPIDETICEGESVNFNILATGASLTYQWRFNGTDLADGGNITGATSNSLEISSSTTADAGIYTCQVTGVCGSETSTPANLVVNEDVTITDHPDNKTRCPGDNVTFSIVATGSNLSYQWQKDGTDIGGETNSGLIINNIDATDAGVYRCVVTGNCGIQTSIGALLTVDQDVTITQEPVDLDVCEGGNAGFTIIATGNDIVYQWKFNGSDMVDGGNITGANTNSLDISNLITADDGIYLCEVTGTCGTANTSPANLTIKNNLVINSHPLNLTACPGENASFSVSATGTNLSYQWQKDGTNLPGEINPGLNLINVSSADEGVYRCVITSDCGSQVSNGGQLTVNDDVIITAQPDPSVTICEDDNLNLNVAISGTALSYQWQRNGTDLTDGGNITGSTTDNLIITSIDPSQAGVYTVIIDGLCGSVNSDLSTVTVDETTVITQHPAEYNVVDGNDASFSVIAEGANLTYQWQKDGSNLSDGGVISGSSTATLDLTSVSTANAGAYRCIVTGNCNSVISNPANLIVNVSSIITAQPQSIERCELESATFTVSASGSGLTYQWRKDGTDLVDNANISGVATNNLIISSVTAADAGAYTCIVNGESSAPALLTVHLNTVINLHPIAATKCVGENVVLDIEAEGSSLTYIWQKDGSDLSDGGNISGSTTDILSITGITTANDGTYRCVVSGTCGTANSNPAIIAVSEITQITLQPADQNICEGSTAIFSVQADGDNLTYQWKKNGTDITDDARISGSATNNLSIANANLTDVGSYTCLVTGDCGNENSNIAQLTVNPITQITLQPASKTGCENDNISLSVLADGIGLSYQWQKDGINLSDGGIISGSATANLNLSGITSANAGSYVCNVTGVCGFDNSDPAIISSYDNTVITSQPVGGTICENSSITLTVDATGSGLTYQWKHNGVNIADTGKYSGTQSANLVISNADLDYSGTYTCLVSGNCGNENSNLVSVNIEKSTIINIHPSDALACDGDDLILAVNADGSGLNYQWQKDGVNLSDNATFSGTSTTLLTITGITPSEQGSYRCIVSGSCGTQNSDPAVISAGTNTTITAQPAGGNYCENDNLLISIAATGDNLTYQWKRNGTNITDGGNYTGATTPNLTINSLITNNAGTFSCLVTGACGSENSALATINVNKATTITIQPAEVFGCEGDVASFAVVAEGDGLGYQWQKDGLNLSDGANISGSSTEMLTISNIATADAGSYRVVVSGTCNSVNSDPAVLSAFQNTIISLQPVDGTYCSGDLINLTTMATGGNLSYQWKQNGLALQDTGNISGSTAPNLFINNSTDINSGTYTCFISGACGSENSSPALVEIEENTTISLQPVDQTKCTGEIAVFIISADGENITYQWEKDGGPLVDGGNISGATTPILTVNNVTVADNGVYRCVITGNCGDVNSDAAQLTVNEYPAASGIIVGPTEICQGDSNIIFEVASIANANEYIWDLPIGMSIINGEGTRLIEVYSTPGETGGNITVQGNNLCGTGTISPVHNVIAHEIPVANAGPDQNICSGTTTLDAVNPGTANGLWSVLNGPAVVQNINQYNSQIDDLREGSNYLLWTVSQNNCSSSDTVLINNNSVTVDAGVDQTICTEDIELEGSDIPDGALGYWSAITGTASFVNGTDPNTTASGFATGTNELTWTVSKAGCTAVDTVVIDNQKPTQAYAGIDQSLCKDSTVLSGNNPLVGTGTWTVITGAVSIANMNQYNSPVTSLGMGDNILRWTTSNGICTTIDEVTISNNKVNVNAGVDQLICDRTADLAATAPVVGMGNWSVISGSAIFVNTNQHDTRVTGLASGDNTLRWIITNEGCISADTVVITNDSPTTSDAGPDQIVTSNTATLQGSIPSVGTGEWILISGSATISEPTLFNTTITDLGLGDNSFRWVITHNSCTSSDDVTITNYMSTETNAGEDQTLCSNSTTLNGSVPTIGFGEWSVIQGAATFFDNSEPKTTVTNLGPGDNILRWTVWENGYTWDEVVITNNTPTTANAGSDRTLCADSAFLSANEPIIGEGTWTVVGGSALFADSSVYNTEATNLAKGDNILKWTITNKGCTSSDEVIITNDLPTTAVAGDDQVICTNLTTLNPNTPSVGTGTWEVLSGAGTFNGNAVSNLAQGDNVLRWSITQNACYSTDELIITNNSPSEASAGLDKVICTDSITLSGNNPLHGNGVWTIQSGSATFDNIFIGNTEVNNISKGINVFRWTITNEGCIDFDEVVVNNASVTSIAGSDQILCAETTILEANAPSVGTGTWSVVGGSGSAQFENPNQPDTRVNGLDKGNNILRWTIQHETCVSSSDVVITNNMPTEAVAGADQSLCTSTTTLKGNLPAIGTGTWSILGGAATLDDPANPNSTVNNLDYGVNTLRWTIENEGCVSSDEVVIFNNTTSISSAGDDQSICSDSTMLYGNNPVYGSGTWTVVSGSATFADNNNYNTTVTDLGQGTNILQWKITNYDCSSNDNVSIINNIPTQAVAGADQTLCSNTAGLHANSPAIGSGEWTLVSGAAEFTDRYAPNPTVSNLKAGQNTLRWTITNNGCSLSDDVVITNDLPQMADAGADMEICSEEADLLANHPGTGTGVWQVISGSATINNPSSYNTHVIELGFGTNTLRWTIRYDKCTTYDEIVIINNQTDIYAGIDQKIGTSYTTLAANNPTVGTGSWSVVGGAGEFSESINFITEVDNISAGLNTYRWSVTINGCVSFDDVMVTYNVPPVASFVANKYAGCPPLEVYFVNNSLDDLPFLWDFDDGTTSTEVTTNHVFTESGVYNASLTVYGDAGEIITKDTAITVYDLPTAAFRTVSHEVYLPDEQAMFINESELAVKHFWEFGDGNTSEEIEPWHTYESEGSYEVSLVVESVKGCLDTLAVENAIEVFQSGLLKFPNAFTPNPVSGSGGTYSTHDYTNDVFFPVGEGVNEYHLEIFNKWGILIFESHDINIGWDGYYNGRLLDEGVYVWKVTGQYNNGKKFKQVGTVLLMRQSD